LSVELERDDLALFIEGPVWDNSSLLDPDLRHGSTYTLRDLLQVHTEIAFRQVYTDRSRNMA